MTQVSVHGMTCQGCESVVETAIELLDGVETVDADRYENVVTVTGDVAYDDVATKIEMAGYEPVGETDAEPAGGEGDSSDSADDAPADEAAEADAAEDEASTDELEE